MEEHVRPSISAGTVSPLSSEALRELQQRAAAALSASREQAARLEADIARQLDEIAEAIGEQLAADQRSASAADQQREAEIARLTAELTAAQEAAHAALEAHQRERDALADQVDELQARYHTAQGEWQNQLLDFEAKLREQQALWSEQRSDWSIVRSALERERDELQNKFTLALEDVQRLREHVAELEHDLSRRPEAAQADSAELVALRAERDALAGRVEELELQSAAQTDTDAEQQLADLQRRFEMAVEDVRDLKTKNAKLESQLSAASASAARPIADSDPGGMDWESQKRRLLAALDEGEGQAEGPTPKERATIEGTIEMTDAVVAEKDRRIAELTAELEAARNSPDAGGAAYSQQLNDLLDADELIAEHRRRAQQLEREMEEKLRSAELEISVERAKIARQKVELEELRANIEGQRQLFEQAGGKIAPGAPRRRWLSKLGIDGKDKE